MAGRPEKHDPTTVGEYTRALHGGNEPGVGTGALRRPLVMANSYLLPEDPAGVGWSNPDRLLYTRTTGPTRRHGDEARGAGGRRGRDGGGERCRRAARDLLSRLRSGDHVIVFDVTYGAVCGGCSPSSCPTGWIVAGLLPPAYLVAGGQKALRTPDKLLAPGIAWAVDLPSVTVRLIGVAEVLGAMGLILPPRTGIAPILAPITRYRARAAAGECRPLPPETTRVGRLCGQTSCSSWQLPPRRSSSSSSGRELEDRRSGEGCVSRSGAPLILTGGRHLLDELARHQSSRAP